MKRETWLAVTAALALAALGGIWFAVKAPDLADPGEPSVRPPDLTAITRAAPARRFYAPGIDQQLLEIAAQRPLFNQRRQSYGTAASLALPALLTDPTASLAPLRGSQPVATPTPRAASGLDVQTASLPTANGTGLGAEVGEEVAAAIETAILGPVGQRGGSGAGAASPSAGGATNGARAAPAASATPQPRPAPAATPPRPAATSGTAPAAASPAPTPPPARVASTPPASPQPTPQPVATVYPPPAGPSIPPGALALAGVFPRADGRAAALIRLPDNSIIEGGVGATVAGWRIESTTPISATLWNGRERVTIRLPGR